MIVRDESVRSRSADSPNDSDSLKHDNHSVLFVDQTAQLGGAELCLRDTILARGNPNDRVVLFQHGPLANCLEQQGVGVSVFRLGSDGESIGKSSGLLRKLGASGSVARLAHKLASVARGTDLIYANTAKSLVIASLAGAIAGRPVIYHLHDILSAEHFSASNLRLLVFLANRFTHHVIANSHASAKAFIDAGGRRSDLSVIYNGFDLESFHQAIALRDSHRARIRTALGVSDEFVVALFGRFAAWKGQHVAIEAIRDLPGVHLMLVGDALFGETDYANTITEQIDRSGIKDRVHLMGFRDDVPALMQAADSVIHCSTAPEPFGRVIVEAMLSDRPVIATRGGGASELVSDGETGFLVAPESPNGLANAIATMRDDADGVGAIVDAAGNYARSEFELSTKVREIDSVIDRVINSPHSKRRIQRRLQSPFAVNR